MKTIGDKIQDKALSKIGEKSLFTKGSFFRSLAFRYLSNKSDKFIYTAHMYNR